MNISVIISTYNYGSFIQLAIQSILAQEYHGGFIEVIVIDDGSTDDTVSIVTKLQQRHPIVQYYQQPNVGKAFATMRGIATATGDIIFTLDADDWLLPGKIHQTIEIFNRHPNVVHVASPAKIVWEDGSRAPVNEPIPAQWLGRELEGSALLNQFYHNNILFGGGSTFAARASALKSIPWHPGIDMYTDEWLVIQTLLRGNSYFLPEPLSVWRIHGSNYSGGGGEALHKKNRRLSASSATVSSLLQEATYPTWLQRAYSLKHAVRQMAWKEAEGTKTLQDALSFAWHQIFRGGHSLRLLYRYHAFQRLIRWW